MREKKFKAWDIKNKKFIEFDDLDISITLGYCRTKNSFEFRVKDRMGFPEETILLEYTGYHDRYGNEIYGKDLVREKNGKITEVNIPDFYVLNFDDGDFRDTKDCEVIGNIFENSELLK